MLQVERTDPAAISSEAVIDRLFVPSHPVSVVGDWALLFDDASPPTDGISYSVANVECGDYHRGRLCGGLTVRLVQESRQSFISIPPWCTKSLPHDVGSCQYEPRHVFSQMVGSPIAWLVATGLGESTYQLHSPRLCVNRQPWYTPSKNYRRYR